MNIALIGYGKMGKAIEEAAIKRNHRIVLRIDQPNLADFTTEKIAGANVAIEFTGPESAFDNVRKCLSFGMPVVSGSTGWLDKLAQAKEQCLKLNGALLYSSNFSIGVNIFFEINKRLAAMMANYPEYEVILEETHHTQKLDAPSGTAITLAEQILEHSPKKRQWVNALSDNPADLEIISQRVDPAPGTHRVQYSSAIDDIEIVHTAHNRNGFAVGAVMAAEFLAGKKGVFKMADVLDL